MFDMWLGPVRCGAVRYDMVRWGKVWVVSLLMFDFGYGGVRFGMVWVVSLLMFDVWCGLVR